MFTEQERQIFGPYDRGDGQEVFADPLRIRRRLRDLLDGDVAKAVARTKGEIPALRLEAMDRLLAAAVLALDLVPFNLATGQGAKEDLIVCNLNAFLDWEEVQKKTDEGTPGWPGASGPVFSNGEASLPGMPSGVPCSSTSTG